LNVTILIEDDVIIYYDNTYAIPYARDPKYHGKSKHINAKNHFIHDIIA
jgi:hypothetical protein